MGEDDMIFIEKIMNHPQAKHNLKWRYTIIAKVIEIPFSKPELWISILATPCNGFKNI
jgi:hypothetical protein